MLALVVFICIFSQKIFSVNHRENSFYKEAAAVCANIISEYRSCKIEEISNGTPDDFYRLTGISYVRQMDFNDDGRNELLIAYSSAGKYFAEVWGYHGKEFINLYRQEANTVISDAEYGSWITIYRRAGKYYIGKLKDDNNEEIEFFGIKNHKFKSCFTFNYDVTGEAYIIDDVVNTSDFETIGLSYISSIKAEKTQSEISSALNSLSSNNSAAFQIEKTDEQKKADAYYKIIDSKNQKYGKASVNLTDNMCFADGTAVVELIDFDGDGNEELLIISRKTSTIGSEESSTPQYITEIFGWNGTAVRKIFEAEWISTYMGKPEGDIFYILQKTDERVNLCSNTYTYGKNPDKSWKGTSRICEMTSPDEITATFTAVFNRNYDYRSYTINGTRVKRSEFDERGYKVPYFCNESEYNTEEFTVTVLKGDADRKEDIEKLIERTQNTIKTINSHYDETN